MKKYTSNEVIAETESDITRFAQTSYMTPMQCAEKLGKKTLWWEDVYEENVELEIFIEGLDVSIRHFMH